MSKNSGSGFFLADLSSNLLVVFLILFALVSILANRSPAVKVDLADLSRIRLDTGRDFVDTLYAYDAGHAGEHVFIEMAGPEIRASLSDWSGRFAVTGDHATQCARLGTLAGQGKSVTIFVMAEQTLVAMTKGNCLSGHVPEVLFVPRALQGHERDWSAEARSLLGSHLGPEAFRLRLLKLLEGGQGGHESDASQGSITGAVVSWLRAVFRWGDFILSLLAVIVVVKYAGGRLCAWPRLHQESDRLG